MLIIILSWIALFITISLIGKFFIRSLVWYEYFWVGLFAVLVILQIWSIFLPINIYLLIVVFILSIISLIVILKRKNLILKVNNIKKFTKGNFNILFASAIVILIISYFSSLSVGWEDTYLYHLNAVKWSNLYPTVPGLVNLNSRLAFNSSFFLFASMIDNWFLNDRSSHVAVSLLASVLSLQIIWVLNKSKNRLIKLFALFIIPLVVSNIIKSTTVASLSPDFALSIIVLAICLELLENKERSLIVAGLLSIALVTVKFSGLIFALLIIIQIVVKLGIFKSVIKFIVPTILIIIPFLVRNILLSGWLLYPLPYFGFNVSWAAPKIKVQEMYDVIHAWAITPGEGWYKSIGLSFWEWFPDWYLRNSSRIEMKLLFLGILVLIVAILFFKNIKIKNMLFELSLGVISLLSIIYTLITAPDFRFGEVYIWVFFAISVSFVFNNTFRQVGLFKTPIMLAVVILTILVSWPPRTDSKPIWRSVRWENSFPVTRVFVKPVDGSPPFEVYKTGKDTLCGNSELPCTPDSDVFIGKVKEIVPGDISKGFYFIN